MDQKRLLWRGLLTAAASLGFVASAVAWLHPWLPWWAELPMHLSLHHALAQGAVGIALAVAGSRRWAMACAVVAVCHLLPPLAWLPPRTPSTDAPLRVLVANVLTGNPGHARLLALIEREQPDVVALVEVDDDWLAALAPLTAAYPHHLSETRDDNFGVALFSRRPFASAAIIHPGAFELPAIDVRLAGELPLRVVLAHPPPPITGDYVAVRDETFAALATLLAGDTSAVLVGDLNCTPWTAPFRRLLRDGHLRDTRMGAGAQASWPAGLGRLGIPIDHVLVGSAVAVGERRLGEAIGSDHRPLLAQLGLRPGG